MTPSLPLIDADAHVVEPTDLWSRHLPEDLRARAPRVSAAAAEHARRWKADVGTVARWTVYCQSAGLDVDRVLEALTSTRFAYRYLEVDGAPIWEAISDRIWAEGGRHTMVNYLDGLLSGFDAASHARALGRMGVARSYVYPTAGLWLFGIDDLEPAFASALVHAYNGWLRAHCAPVADVVRGVGVVCRHDPASMVAEVERVAAWGWRAVMVRPNPVRGRTLGDPAYEPFWATCERLGVAVAIHEGTHARLATAGRDRFATRFARHACSHPMEQMMAFLSLLEGGVLERHPRLRVAFLEAGAGWVPYWLWRLDHLEYANLRDEVKDTITMAPSEYFRRQCFVACEPSEPGLREVVDLVGAGALLYGSDYPHMDHGPHVRDDVGLLVDRLGRETAEAILWANPARFYGETGA
jgi:predicted TIM-barrel fold metal-dependent hydrolase